MEGWRNAPEKAGKPEPNQVTDVNPAYRKRRGKMLASADEHKMQGADEGHDEGASLSLQELSVEAIHRCQGTTPAPDETSKRDERVPRGVRGRALERETRGYAPESSSDGPSLEGRVA